MKTRLAPCPKTPNCVSTRDRGRAAIAPILFRGSPAAARTRLLAILRSLPRAEIVAQEPEYVHVLFRSFLFRFVDDVELEIEAQAREIHFRSAARTGRYDFEVNRKRMETIRRLFTAGESG